jgi:hypothetical protein
MDHAARIARAITTSVRARLLAALGRDLELELASILRDELAALSRDLELDRDELAAADAQQLNFLFDD